MLGVAGVRRFVQETATLPLHEMRNAILERVAEWRVGQSADDISLILVEV
jgi:serine phosphatase RsbU (regulator of sigma subunit)